MENLPEGATPITTEALLLIIGELHVQVWHLQTELRRLNGRANNGQVTEDVATVLDSR